MADPVDALGFTALGGLDERGLDALREIYEEAFPARQRQPFEELVAEHESASRDLAVIAVHGKLPIGFCFLSPLESVGHLFLTYFAVSASSRAAGVGRALWRATVDALHEQGERAPIVLEVESEREPGLDQAEIETRRRRIEFWRGVGATMILEDGYEVPSYDGTGTESMCLMRFGDAPLTSPELSELVLALYRDGYGLGPRDPLVRRAQGRRS